MSTATLTFDRTGVLCKPRAYSSCTAVSLQQSFMFQLTSRVGFPARPGESCVHKLQNRILARTSFSGVECGHVIEELWTTEFKSTRRRLSTVRSMIFGPELGYEMADQINSWILPTAPEPVQFPRKTLNMKFAVLLMRSSYESVDALDFIPMDKFQVKFWKLRQSEVEPYTFQYRPLRVRYGDLTDPLYFDFISFAQFATISNEMRTGEILFKEKLGSDGETRLVRRDESLKDNSKLPSAFSTRLGDAIYQRLLEGFEGESFNVPPPCPEGSSFSCLVEAVQNLLQVFVDQGYALKAVVDQVEPASGGYSGKLRVKVEGSATLWGLRTLVSRRALVLSDFAALAVGGFLRASQRLASYKVRYSDTTVEELWTIS